MNRFIDIHTHNPAPARADLVQIEAVMVTASTATPPEGLFSAAIHPYSMAGFDITWIDRLQQIAASGRCVAIGETGLDMRQEYAATEKQQRAVLDEHLFLASKLQKPLIIHAVKARDEVLRRLDSVTVPVVFHGFAGTAQAAAQITERGHYISLGHKITHDEALIERARQFDRSKLLLETDDHDSTIQQVYRATAAALGVEIQELQRIVEHNFCTIFPHIII